MNKRKKVKDTKPISLKTKLIAGAIAISLLGGTTYVTNEIIKEKNRDKNENVIGYYDISPLNFKVHDDNFVVLNVGNHNYTGVDFQDKKIKMCNEKDISVGIIVTPNTKSESGIYDDVELAKGIVSKYNIDFPVYLNIDNIILDESLNIEMKTKLIKDFLEKCSANNIYVGVYGTDTNLCRLKKYCGITEYDAFIKMDKESIEYDGIYFVWEDLNGKIISKADISRTIKVNKLNNKENFISDEKHIVSKNEELIDIAMQYGMSEKELLDFNNCNKKDVVDGASLRIPSKLCDKEIFNDYEKLDNPVKGCDISNNQVKIDWGKISNNFGFVILKENQGLNLDNKFLENVRMCSLSNIPYGVYCYNQYNGKNFGDKDEFRKIQEKQVDFVIENLKNKKITYPIFLDLEVSSNLKFSEENSSDDIKIILDVWNEKMNNAGYNHGIYTNRSNYKYIQESVDYDINDEMYVWIAGGNQYTGETMDIEFDKVIPTDDEYQYDGKKYKANIVQSTDSAINAGAANYKNHLDINYSYIDFENKTNTYTYTNNNYDIKEFKRINFNLLSLLAANGILIPAGIFLLKKKIKSNQKRK